ncbi:DNA-directed RNA polymerase subunit delta [Cytobacillus dafuensis]|uniref:Probable DNA-directed RNA polymerase subunit delta n=1 Tax=Cytobacillus dafuensis TaxID=1742359 RepID=A0A5B8Z9Y8_CYTDA|nr:DNA-directed RNA polymerase subunit delta [Cytobacillus dafuensis]QED49751.1 DNA-directed RNA polymerase subunit delta [Cytobacillus dafuensis]
MNLNELTKEELQEMSLIEIAYELLRSRKEAMAFKEIMDELINLLELSDDQVKAKIAQFYTDLNIDGRFLGLGDNRWGLRVWYPVDQVEEEVVTAIKPKKKKAKKAQEDEDLDDYDDLDDEDIDYDDIDDLDDEDELLDDEDDEDLLEDDEDLEDDELIERDEEYDLGDEDEELDDEDSDLDEDEEDI